MGIKRSYIMETRSGMSTLYRHAEKSDIMVWSRDTVNRDQIHITLEGKDDSVTERQLENVVISGEICVSTPPEVDPAFAEKVHHQISTDADVLARFGEDTEIALFDYKGSLLAGSLSFGEDVLSIGTALYGMHQAADVQKLVRKDGTGLYAHRIDPNMFAIISTQEFGKVPLDDLSNDTLSQLLARALED